MLFHTVSARWKAVLALGPLLFGMAASAADGLQARFDKLQSSPLQGRLMLGSSASARSDSGYADSDVQKLNSLSLMGDYYLSAPLLGMGGGLRATSGLLLGQRPAVWSSPSAFGLLAVDRRSVSGAALGDSSATPYLGIGYTGSSTKGGWGVSADLGLMAISQSSGVRLGKIFSGNQSLDDSVRELRLSPALQVGVSYAF